MKKSTQFTIAGTVALTCLVANPVLAATIPPLTVPVQASQTTAAPQREVVFVTTTGQELARTTITATATGWPDLRLVTGSPTGAGDYQLPSGYVYGGRRIPADPLNCDAIGGTDYVTLTPAGDPEPYLVRRANFHLVDYLTNELISHQSYFGPANQQVWAVLPAGYHWADPTLAAEGLFLTASAAEDHGNLQELVVVKDAPAEPGQHPDGGAPEQPGTTPNQKPDSGAPEQPDQQPDQKPDSGAPEQPDNQPDQKPDSGAPNQPDNQPDQNPDSGAPAEPGTTPGQQPDSGAPEQPDNQPDQKPDSGVPEQPDNQPDQHPDSGAPEQPDNQPDQKPDSGAPEQPDQKPGQKPDSGAPEQPDNQPDQKPDSGAPEQSGTTPDQQPDSGAPNQPDQQPDQKPDGGVPAEPGTTPDQQPEGDGQPQQPGNPTGPSAAPGPATPPRQTKEGALGPVAPSSPGVPVDSATADRLVDGLLDAGVAKDAPAAAGAPAALPQTGDRDCWGLAMLGWVSLLGLGGRVLRRPKDQN